MKDKIVITAALPYANGDIHIGHLLEYIQADIYTRFLKVTGKDALYMCASDQHGTPIEINAKKAGIDPKKFVEKFWKEHQEDFASVEIKFDNYYKTHSPENKELAEWFFTQLRKKGHIYIKKIKAIYCETCTRFLPDRFVKGQCPHCEAQDQYGDVCESCNSVLKGADLVKPYCSICKNIPIEKETAHYFFKLSSFTKKLEKWLGSKKSDVQPEVRNLLKGWLKSGLDDWCISRDGPYFGFEIPGSKKETGEVKYFYVWLDAPIGYIASTKNYCDSHGLDWKDYWFKGHVHHFIGKDIIYFHYLFWIAQFIALDIPLPTLTTHGFITVNGTKMSKSRGTFFTAKDFLKDYPAQALRFFYASHLQRKVVDVDLNLEDFVAVNNNILLGNLGNFCFRTLSFAQKNFGSVEKVVDEKKLIKDISALISKVKDSYEKQDFRSAVKYILEISDKGNVYFQSKEPWKTKDEAVIGFCVNLARNLAIVVSPILPSFSKKIFASLGEKKGSLGWSDISFDWKGKVKKIDHLVEKIEEVKQVANEKDDGNSFPLKIRVGKIIEVKDHPKADKLYVLQVDFGDEKRQIVAGLKGDCSKDELKGRKTVFCVNMKKAKLRGELSEGMILIAQGKDKKVTLLDVGKAKVGDEAQFGDLGSQKSEVTYEQFSKLKMQVQNKGTVWNGKILHINGKNVKTNAKDGARIV